jgi:hypothetical protein
VAKEISHYGLILTLLLLALVPILALRGGRKAMFEW